jgi:hypothetical protein
MFTQASRVASRVAARLAATCLAVVVLSEAEPIQDQLRSGGTDDDDE